MILSFIENKYRITDVEYYDFLGVTKHETFTKKELYTIESIIEGKAFPVMGELNKLIDINNGRYELRFMFKNFDYIKVIKFHDDWWLVSKVIQINDSNLHFKCDQFDEFIELLNNFKWSRETT